MFSSRPATSALRQACRVTARTGRRPATEPWRQISTAKTPPRPGRQQPPSTALTRAHSTSSSPTSSKSPSSVSPDEVAHFNALAATWWDPYGSSRLLHQMNPLRHDFIRECIRSENGSSTGSFPKTFLDIGCGGGIFAESAARLSTTVSVTAIDPSAEVLNVARTHARRDPDLHPPRLHYRQASIEDLSPEKDGVFDMVTLFEVLEHVATDPGAFLDQCGQLVRPGGWLVMSTMARTWTSWLTTIVAAEDILGIVPRGTHDWAKYVNADELMAHFEPGGAAASSTNTWHSPRFQGVVYAPALGWQAVPGGEKLGNYFFAIRKADVAAH